MKRRIIDMIIGQVLMAVMLIMAGIAYEGIGYSDFSDIAPYIQLAIITLLISVMPSVVMFKSAIEFYDYVKKNFKRNETKVSEETEQA